MTKKALVLLAEGFEEVEAVTPIDVLRRAGIEVTVASLGAKQVKGAHDIIVVADTTLTEVRGEFDALVLHGGSPGAANLAGSPEVKQLIQNYFKAGKFIAAICAAPAVVLAPTGILKGKRATCFPGCEKDFGKEVTFVKDSVVIDGNVITSRGLGTAHAFSLAIVGKLLGPQEEKKLGERTLAMAEV